MNKEDSDRLVAYMQKLWPEWRPRSDSDPAFDADLEAWGQLFGRINSADLARQVLKELKVTTDWRGPKRAQVIEILRQQIGPMHAESSHQGHPGVYIQCVSHPTRPGLVGHFLTLYWPTDKPMPSEHAIHAQMSAFREERESLYGGAWRLIRSSERPLNDGDMLRRRGEMRPATRATPGGPMSRTMAAIARNLEKAQAHPPASR